MDSIIKNKNKKTKKPQATRTPPPLCARHHALSWILFRSDRAYTPGPGSGLLRSKHSQVCWSFLAAWCVPGNIPNTEQLQVSGEKSHTLPSRSQAQWAPERALSGWNPLGLYLRWELMSFLCLQTVHTLSTLCPQLTHTHLSLYNQQLSGGLSHRLSSMSSLEFTCFFCSDGGNYPTNHSPKSPLVPWIPSLLSC